MSNRGVSTRYWADWFWKRAGGRPDFPADIGYAAMCALEVYVEEVGDLTTFTAASRIEGVGIRIPDGNSERRIHGCLVVGRRGAAILVEKSDDAAQKRFTIAHECAHFILEVRTDQERAAIRLGHDFSGVLHGHREATPIERLDARLHNIRSDALVHFMDRTATGAYGCGRIHEAECPQFGAFGAQEWRFLGRRTEGQHALVCVTIAFNFSEQKFSLFCVISKANWYYRLSDTRRQRQITRQNVHRSTCPLTSQTAILLRTHLAGRRLTS